VANKTVQVNELPTEAAHAACGQCALGKLCFPHALPAAFKTLLPLANETRTRLARGEFLFQANEPQAAVYAVKAGFLKAITPLADGQEKIVAFHTKGDVLGLDSLGGATHRTAAVALNGCEVCVISLDKFDALLERPTESVHVRQLLALEIARVQNHAGVIGSLDAKQRVATFLLDMSERWENCGYSRTEFVLFMSRKEIGNFLGLTFETVSRTLSYFQAKKWLTVHGKNVLIRDLPALRKQIA
jgi:CRP/FNR family transcriptional regulator